MIQPQIGKGISLGKPRAPKQRTNRSEQLNGRGREGESVAGYQLRVLRQIKSSKGEDEPQL